MSLNEAVTIHSIEIQIKSLRTTPTPLFRCMVILTTSEPGGCTSVACEPTLGQAQYQAIANMCAYLPEAIVEQFFDMALSETDLDM